MTKTEHETRERFAGRDRVALAAVSRRIELAVIGGDWGANGHTTMAQADTLGHELGLRAGARLLDLGAWPRLGLRYLAAGTGCQVVLADAPTEGRANTRFSSAKPSAGHSSARSRTASCAAPCSPPAAHSQPQHRIAGP